jgi:shikimate dehydrogenase
MTSRSLLSGLIGTGITRSLTPPMHEREGARHGVAYVYRVLDLDLLRRAPESVGELVRCAQALGYDGLNITHPCKQLVIPHLDELSPDAAAIGAVNTVVMRDGRTVGHNTDCSGFAHGFTRGLPGAPTGRVTQVGAGGAGAAVAQALLGLGTEQLVVVDHDDGRGADLAAGLGRRFGAARVRAAAVDELAALVAASDGVVNATPVGMADHPGTPFPTSLLCPRHWVADIVYRPLRTQLVQEAEALGCRVLTGAGMAVFQAVDAFTLITGLEPDADAMLAHFGELVAAEAATPC